MTPFISNPGSGALTNMERDKILERIMARHHYSGDALIEILHAAQQLYGYLSRPLMKSVARRLGLPPSKVLGVATFYHLFRLTPPMAHSAVVCIGTACYVAGGQELIGELRRQTDPANWAVGTGRCMGSCGLAPIVVCDGAAVPRVRPDQLEVFLKEANDGGNSKSDTAH